MSLRVCDLSVSRGGRRLLAGVSFDLSPGQALILRGRNGIGKTTLLRTLAGLQEPVTGTITGDDIAYAAHADAIKSAMSVRENLQFWAGVFGTGCIDHALVALDLIPLQDRMAANLSAGQKRRLGLARLMVTGQKIWAMDEPTVSLDQASVAALQGVVADHLAQGGMAVISTHVDWGGAAQVLDLTPFVPERIIVDAFDEVLE